MSSFQRNIDLDLKSRWFTKEPVLFPYPALRQAGPILSSNHAWECLETIDPVTGAPGEEWTVIGAIQWEDQPHSITKIRVTWQSNNIDGTVKGEYKHVPIASGKQRRMSGEQHDILTASQRKLASEWYGRHVFDFVARHVGSVVGDGECWTLARQALVEAGKKAVAEGHEPPMVSLGRVHGECVLEWAAESQIDVVASLKLAKVAKGDILEMNGARFYKEKMLFGMLKETTTVNMGNHTAVVESVEGSKIKVVEQNANVQGRVTRGEYELSEMLSGKITIYRPVGQSMGSPPGASVDLGALCQDY